MNLMEKQLKFVRMNIHPEIPTIIMDNQIIRTITRNHANFTMGKKIINKYLSHKQINTSSYQQKWVGPYIITRIYDNDTIQIKTIHKKELGRWTSIKFLPYDWVNSNQIYTFDQKKMKILRTSLDYNEVHHKMLKCYSMQLFRKRTQKEEMKMFKILDNCLNNYG